MDFNDQMGASAPEQSVPTTRLSREGGQDAETSMPPPNRFNQQNLRDATLCFKDGPQESNFIWSPGGRAKSWLRVALSLSSVGVVGLADVGLAVGLADAGMADLGLAVADVSLADVGLAVADVGLDVSLADVGLVVAGVGLAVGLADVGLAFAGSDTLRRGRPPPSPDNTGICSRRNTDTKSDAAACGLSSARRRNQRWSCLEQHLVGYVLSRPAATAEHAKTCRSAVRSYICLLSRKMASYDITPMQTCVLCLLGHIAVGLVRRLILVAPAGNEPRATAMFVFWLYTFRW